MAKPKAKPPADLERDGFEFLSPWMPSVSTEALYCIGLSPKHGRMWRWRLRRIHDVERETGKPYVYWVLDESSAAVDPGPDSKLLATAQTFDEPRRLTHPRDKLEATATVLGRWERIGASPVGEAGRHE